MNVCVIIPAFNEGSRLTRLLSQIHQLHPRLPLIVVDDGSHPPVSSPYASILRHQLNLGKGAALKTGIEYALQQGADAFILMDADLQHHPQHLAQFIKLLKNNDVVLGSRTFDQSTPLVRFLGNKFASIYISFLFGIYVSDILSGYRAFTKKAYRFIQWQSSRYAVETEMIAHLGKNQRRLKWIEIPIETIYIDKYKGVTIIDAIKILIQTWLWKLS